MSAQATRIETHGTEPHEYHIDRREVWTRSKGRVGGRQFIYDVYLDGLKAEPIVYGTDRLSTARRIAKAYAQARSES